MRFYDNSMKRFLASLPAASLLVPRRAPNTNDECRYLFYNSLNKRTQSSLCLFIQFSLRSIISKFFSSLFSSLSCHFIIVDDDNVVISSQRA